MINNGWAIIKMGEKPLGKLACWLAWGFVEFPGAATTGVVARPMGRSRGPANRLGWACIRWTMWFGALWSRESGRRMTYRRDGLGPWPIIIWAAVWIKCATGVGGVALFPFIFVWAGMSPTFSMTQITLIARVDAAIVITINETLLLRRNKCHHAHTRKFSWIFNHYWPLCFSILLVFHSE